MLEYIRLGGTLFTPASFKNLADILSLKKYPTLKSLVIDFEDALDEKEYQNSLKSLKTLLKNHQKNSLLVFIRPKNPTNLKERDIS